MVIRKYDDLVKLKIAVERDTDEARYFKMCIGNKGNTRWYSSGFDLNFMQMAILDTMYDAGQGKTFWPSELVNDRTKLAYVTRFWEAQNFEHRDNISCGHDEVYTSEYTLRRITKWVDRWDNETEVVMKTRDKDVADKWVEDMLESTIDELDIDVYRKKDVERVLLEHDMTDGNCAWPDKKDPATGKQCSHHAYAEREMVFGYYREGTNGPKDKENWVYFDECDHDKLIAHVNDEAVLKMIKSEIPKMKTEARPWLESVSRGLYELNWWWRINNEIRRNGKSQDNEAMNGKQVNGWEFTATKRYGNHGHYFEGRWSPVEKLLLYDVYHQMYSWGGTSQMEGLRFYDKEAANSVVFLMNNAKRISACSTGLDEGTYIVKEYEVHTDRDADFDPNRYTPQEYLKAVSEDKLDTFEVEKEMNKNEESE